MVCYDCLTLLFNGYTQYFVQFTFVPRIVSWFLQLQKTLFTDLYDIMSCREDCVLHAVTSGCLLFAHDDCP